MLKMAVEKHLEALQNKRDAPPAPRHHENFQLFALEYRRLVTNKEHAIAKVLGAGEAGN